jgi:hypothetical protein
MRIHWVTFADVTFGESGPTSKLASLRYRVITPVRELSGDTFEHRIIPIDAKTPSDSAEAAMDADVVVFSKSSAAANEARARKAQARGTRVIFDVCDNRYDAAEYGPHYLAMTMLADTVVCNTPEMAQIIASHTGRMATVIEDPYEGRRATPRFSPGERLQVLWFGHPTNLDSLNAVMDELVTFSAEHPLDLLMMTQSNPQFADAIAELNGLHPPQIRFAFAPWSLEAQASALETCDLVILPIIDGPRKIGKSANRIVNSLWAGRAAVANPLAAYEPFKSWTPVVASLSEGIASLLETRAQTPGRIAEAQDYIAARYAPRVIAEQWRQVLTCAPAMKDVR